MTTILETETKNRAERPTNVGVVVSDKGEKTIGVVFRFSVKHPRYGKYIRRRTKVQAHDEHNVARMGDVVELASCRPYSKSKNWRLLRVVTAAPGAVVAQSTAS